MPATDSIDATHPLYDARLTQWERCRDCWEGQEKVKSRDQGRRYLPPTEGMIIDGAFGPNPDAIGWKNYNAYLNRALFFGYYSDAVDMSLGLAWTKEPIFEGLVGTPLEYLLTNATHEGESLCRLLFRINQAQIGVGRIGIMADMPAGETKGLAQPYISVYEAEHIINWDAGRVGELDQETLNLVVLDESGPTRLGVFEWQDVERYRVLTLGNVETNENAGLYQQGIYELTNMTGGESGTPAFNETELVVPAIYGKTLDEIPFVFINGNSATSKPSDPPLLSLSDLAISLYQVNADYVQALHASTQPTPVTKGLKPRAPGEKELRLGVGAHIELGDTPNADAWFLELEGRSLGELRQSVQALRDLCSQRAGEIIDQSSRGRESGNALEQRISVRTANLHSIVQSGASGLEKLLKIMGKWLGMSDEQLAEIRVRPNLVFSKPALSAIELKSLVESKLMGGALISLESIHNYLVQRGFTSLSFEELKQQFESEKELAKELLPEPENDLTKTGGANGGPKITPASTGF